MLPPGRPTSLPSPAASVWLRAIRTQGPSGSTLTSSTCKATSSERRSAAAKPISRRVRLRRPRAEVSQVATSRRSRAGVNAATWRAGPAVPAEEAAERLPDLAMRRRPGLVTLVDEWGRYCLF